MRCLDGSLRRSMIESERSPSCPGWFAWSEPRMRMFVGVERRSEFWCASTSLEPAGSRSFAALTPLRSDR